MDCYQLERNGEAIRELLLERKIMLKQIGRELRSGQKKRPEGRIRVVRCRKGFQCYWKGKNEDKWRYLPKKNEDIARKIVNSEFREALLQKVKKELLTIEEWGDEGIPGSLLTVYDELSYGRKRMVAGIISEDEEIVREFYADTYEPLETFGENKQFATARGEYVRSKAEWMIAEMLNQYGIPYQYEYPLILKGHRTVRPDFRCLNVRLRKTVLWEHLGRMDDEEYVNSAIRKIQKYEANGYTLGTNLIITMETSECPLTPESVESRIRAMLI